MRTALIVAVFLLFAVSALAQTSSGAMQQDNPVFRDIEKRIIGDFFGRALGQAKSEEDEDENEGEDDDKGSRGKSDKGGKDKSAKGAKGKSGQMPPGLAKRDRLPPGLAKKLARGEPLPPGLAKRDLPADLEAALPKPGEGQERVIAGEDVVLIEQATGRVLDILEGVLAGRDRN